MLSPGQSDLRGYLLWERYGAEKANNTASLNHLTETLREVVTIFGDIREDCVEGESGKKVRRCVGVRCFIFVLITGQA